MLNEADFLNEISKIIRKRRNIKKISCEKLAELSDTDYSSVNSIENCKQKPRAYTLYKILLALDIDLIKLLTTHNNNLSNNEFILQNKISILSEKEQKDLLKFLEFFELKSK